MKFVIISLLFCFSVGLVASEGDSRYSYLFEGLGFGKRSPEEIYKDLLKEIGNGAVDSIIVDLFADLVNNSTEYHMKSIMEFAFGDENSLKRPEDETKMDDVQILYDKGFKGSGHFLFIHYKASMNTVFVYNKSKKILPSTRKLIESRYPDSEIDVVVPLVFNRDGRSCGIFAIAYATSAILGKDPAVIPFEVNKKVACHTKALRRHIAKMLSNWQLELFPRS